MTELETRILDFAEEREQGSKVTTWERFGWSPTAYTQRLMRLVARPDVEEARPMLVHRLRRVADARVGARAQRSFRRA